MLQMSLHVIEPSVWHLQGRAKMHNEVHLRGARRRIRNMLMKCHERLGLPPEANLTFGTFLETALDVKPDAESFSGDRISWTIIENAQGAHLHFLHIAFAPAARPFADHSLPGDRRRLWRPRWSVCACLCKPGVGSATPFYNMFKMPSGPPLQRLRCPILRRSREGRVQRPSSRIPLRPWSIVALRHRRRRGQSGPRTRRALAGRPRGSGNVGRHRRAFTIRRTLPRSVGCDSARRRSGPRTRRARAASPSRLFPRSVGCDSARRRAAIGQRNPRDHPKIPNRLGPAAASRRGHGRGRRRSRPGWRADLFQRARPGGSAGGIADRGDAADAQRRARNTSRLWPCSGSLLTARGR